MSDLDMFRNEQMRDPEFREYCERMKMHEDIAKSIVAARLSKNLTQKELASLSGISQGDISRIENCDRLPTLKTLSRIAESMGFAVRISFEPVAKEAPVTNATEELPPE